MAADLQTQVTALYDRLAAVNANLSQRALNSSMITRQDVLVGQLNLITTDLLNAEESVRQMQLDMADIVAELRAKS